MMSKLYRNLYILFSNHLPKILRTFSFWSFFTIFTFISKLLSGCRLSWGRQLCSLTFYAFTLIFNIYLHSFSENSLVGCRPLDARGRRNPPHPLCPNVSFVFLTRLCSNHT